MPCAAAATAAAAALLLLLLLLLSGSAVGPDEGIYLMDFFSSWQSV
jgi:hypothetical protein